nr:ADYC domain-containing protein [Myxococcus sp. MH1]
MRVRPGVSPKRPLWAVGLHCALLLLLASGASGCCKYMGLSCPSRGPSKDDTLPHKDCARENCETPPYEGRLVSDDCPSGQCDPESPNGLGIYNLEGHSHCLAISTKDRYCPETFLNTADGIALRLRDANVGAQVIMADVVDARLLDEAMSASEPVKVLEIQGGTGQLRFKGVHVGRSTEPFAIEGGALPRLILALSVKDPYEVPRRYQVRFRPLPHASMPRGAVPKYVMEYQEGEWRPSMSWVNPCSGVTDVPARPDASMAVLPDFAVDSLTAGVSHQPRSVTLACDKGAIATCLDWGYTPWDKQGRPDANRAYLYASCLQAKRAAYFVRFNNLKSYTANNTLIRRRDEFAVGLEQSSNLETLPRLEALWSPRGAECIIPENFRRPELVDPRWVSLLPRCEPVHWTQWGKLATAPAR